MEEHKSLEKWVPSLASKDELYDALEKAFDYRGDVTITLKDNSKVMGYVFNRESKAPEPYVELYPADRDEKTRIYYKDIAALFFSGVDTAAGKSWALWLEKYKKSEQPLNVKS
jgi:hypothetical protein